MKKELKKAIYAKNPSVDDIMREFNNEYSDINAELENGKTLLHYAVITNNLKLIATLSKQENIDCNKQDANGNAPLHYLTTLTSNVKILEKFLEHDVDLHLTNHEGDTILHLLVKVSALDDYIITLLEEYCHSRQIDLKNCHSKNNHGLTPFAIIYSHGWTKNEKLNYRLVQLWVEFFEKQLIHNIDETEINTLCFFLLSHGKSKALIEMLSSPPHFLYLTELIEKCKKDLSFLQNLCDIAAERGDIDVIDTLYSIHPDAVKPNSLAERLFKHPDKAQLQIFLSNLNKKYEYGVYFDPSYPSLTVDTMALILAEKFSSHHYPHKALAISKLQMQSFLSWLKKQNEDKREMREKFAIVTDHAIGLDIQLTSTGEIKILYLDPLGKKGIKEYPQPLKAICEKFPQCEIYIGAMQQQYSGTGCKVFTADNITHFLTSDEYLPHGKDIFEYLSQLNPIDTVEINGVKCHYISLPMRYMRTTQSLFSDGNEWKMGILKFAKTVSSTEKEGRFINKKHEEFERSVEKHLDYSKGGSPVNQRLDYRLSRMRARVINFCCQNSIEHIQQAINSCKVDDLISNPQNTKLVKNI